MTPSITQARAALETLSAFYGDGEPSRDALLSFEGWGSLAPALAVAGAPDSAWEAIGADLLDILAEHPDHLSVARDVADTSFYTPDAVMAAAWELLVASGFTGGRVLEPGCGTGRFLESAPAGLEIDFTGVEIDPTAADIARHLHPAANIITGDLTRTALRRGFDAVIGNVPFSSSRVYSREHGQMPIHRYFMRRAIDALRPGGIAVLVTSRHVVDGFHSPDDAIDGADFSAAVRLPVQAFRGAGAEVVADILVLRKTPAGAATGWELVQGERVEGQRASYGAFGRSSYTYVEHRPMLVDGVLGAEVSHYWGRRPAHIAGSMTATGYAPSPVTVTSDALASDLAAAVAAAKPGLLRTAAAAADPADELSDVVTEDAEGRKEGSFHLVDGALVQITRGAAAPVSRASKELTALVALRDLAVDLLTLESDPATPDTVLDPIRQATLRAYEAYVAKFGALNRGTLTEGKVDPDSGLPTFSWRRPPLGGFRRDPDSTSVFALEQFDQELGEARPAPILLHRINKPLPRIERAESAGEAIAISLGETGRIAPARIAGLLGIDADDVPAALHGLAYTDPGTGSLVRSAEYLSGDIRSKLAAADAAGATENAAALRAVMPEQLDETQIIASLGATWVDAADVQAFAKSELGLSATVAHEPVLALWEVDANDQHDRSEHALTWATPDMARSRILEHALNGTVPVIYDDVWDPARGTTRKVRNQEATLAAEDRLLSMQERFGVWVWEDGARASRLVATYNQRFRSHAPRVHDGSHLTFSGLSADIELWDHQRSMIDRIVSSERTLCAHPVGFGKTLSMIGGAMTLRRFGLARKPLIVVPNHLLDQIAREAKQAFPAGKFLVATKDDLTRDARRLFAARCATGDWDAVVMTHQAFGSIPVSAEAEQDWLWRQLDELEHAQLGSADQYGRGRSAKALARARRNLTARLEELRDGMADADSIRFDQLGVDYLMVDEAHYFKRLGSSARTEGFSQGTSKRAADLELKIGALASQHPEKPIVSLFTGTPWSNSLAETYVWQRYLQPERLQQAGIGSFDGWAANFVQFENRVEVAPDGVSFRMKRRPTAVRNLPELIGMFAEIADVLSQDALDVPRPEARVHNVVVDASQAQREYVASLAERADRLSGGGGNGSDNMLVICSDGRAAATDPGLVGVSGPSPVVTEAADRAASHYREQPGALQVIFCDLGTPKPGDASTYGRIRQALVARGIPNERIRWVHEANTAKAREALFAQCRDGQVSVLLGSTEKLGTGTNIQRLLAAVHHIDAPWRPSDITQRDGRAIRPGNTHTAVDLYRYAARGTFASFMWQTLERKARFIEQLMTIGTGVREAADIGGDELSFGEVKALASGNPLLLEHAAAAADVRRLRTLAAVHRQSTNGMRSQADEQQARATRLDSISDRIETSSASVVDHVLSLVASDQHFAAAVAAGRPAALGGHSARIRHGIQSTYTNERMQLGAYADVRLDLDYLEVLRITVKRSALRRMGAARAAEALGEAMLAEWRQAIDGLPAARSEADELRTSALALLDAAQAATFDRAADLAAAELRLNRIVAALEDETREDVAVAA